MDTTTGTPPLKTTVFTDKAPGVVGPYAQGTRAGNLLFTAGQIALVPGTGKMVVGSVQDETEQVLRNLQAVLEAGGTDMRQVVKATVLLGDMAYFAAMNEVYVRYLGNDPPARTTYQAGALPLGAKVEIELIAIVNDSAQASVTPNTSATGKFPDSNVSNKDVPKAPSLLVKDIMQNQPLRIRDTASVRDAAEMVALSGVGDLMVGDANGRFVGVLSEGDILRAALPDLDDILAEGGTLSDAYRLFLRKGHALSERPIMPLVIRHPLVLHPDDHVARAATVLINLQIRRLPVVDDGRLVGSVSRANICQAVVGEWR